ncbi:hypothetical protein [Kocuria sp.]|uniref:hypothetical protein n=1 Tax=Kocuria sp. TaxID=1871328 RepID=UPI0026DB1848|nr:hypothetical protein [Kocuria sp.]MDO4920082.1 hypothetical protein [Kocuria sp.]
MTEHPGIDEKRRRDLLRVLDSTARSAQRDAAAQAQEDALGTVPVTLLVQIGDGDPQSLGQDTIPLYATPDGSAIVVDHARAAEATGEAIIRILFHDEEVTA